MHMCVFVQVTQMTIIYMIATTKFISLNYLFNWFWIIMNFDHQKHAGELLVILSNIKLKWA